MAADSDGTLTAVVICEGNFHDPDFPKKFRVLLGKLKTILQQSKSKKLKVNKVEPWNSVRVTLTIPKDAAERLRQLASEGSSALRALGILSVQLEGDSVISLRLVGQEIVLRTDNNPSFSEEAAPSNGLGDIARLLANPLQTATASCPSLPTTPTTTLISEPIAGTSSLFQHPSPVSAISSTPVSGSNFEKSPIFKSPNTICPMDGKLPVPPIANVGETREYPFESMTQARVIQRRENTMAVAAALGQGSSHIAVTVSPSTSSVPATTQKLVANNQTTGMALSQTSQPSQPPPPLAIPSKQLVVSQKPALQQQQEQPVKSQFVQPPPPPYPNVTSNSTKSSLTVQHQANTITLPVNSSLNVSSNNIAISSPLLVNLLQNDGVNQAKQHPQSVSVQKHSPVLVQQQQTVQSVPTQLHQAIASNIKPTQDIPLNTPTAIPHSHSDSVLMQGGQIIANNSNMTNLHNVSTNKSLNPSIAVPSLTISNIPTLNNNQTSTQSNTSPTGIGQTQVGNSNLLSPIQSNINVRIQQQQHPRFTQQVLLRQQQQVVHPVGTGARFSSQSQAPQQIINALPQQQLRHPVQANSNQQQQQYITPPPSPHPNGPLMNPANVALQSASSIVNNSQQLQGSSYNHPRWPFKPMDSATKSSFQEFTRYQMQYNLQQQMNQTQSIDSGNASTSNDKQNIDTLGLVNLSDLDELTKNDLDSLLPNLNVNDLDSALNLDGKNALESLLDAKDLDLDLIDQDLGSALNTNFANQNAQTHNCNNNEGTVFPEVDSTLTKTGKQRQYLINPLTGELEPMPSEESDTEPEIENVDAFNEFNSEISNSLYSDDENSCSTAFSKASDHSDTERSSNSEASVRSRYSKCRKDRKDLGGVSVVASGTSSKKSKLSLKGALLREKLQQGLKDKISSKTKQIRDKPTKAKLIATTTSDNKDSPAEKIKLRLKLEKSEPVTPAYKVDISFVQSPKRAQTAVSTSVASSSTFQSSFSTTNLSLVSNSSPTSAQQASTNSAQTNTSHQQTGVGEELRVPPLHISLRGKNSIVIKNSKKDRKKSQSGGEEDDSYFKKSQLKRNHSNCDDQATERNFTLIEESTAFKNNHHAHLVNKILSQGKPTTKQSTEEHSTSNVHNKLLPTVQINTMLENGGNLDSIGNKSNQSSKRNASELSHSSNGIILPETKRRRISQTAHENLTHHQLQQVQESVSDVETYQLRSPIGSTNVGTLPQHSNLSKNQKNTSNNTNYSKSGKNVTKSGKPLVVKSCKSPSHNVVKDPGKSPPTSMGSIVSSTFLTSTPIADTAISTTGSCKSVCLLPQGSSDSISQEKFKQKLLESKGLEETSEISDGFSKSEVNQDEILTCTDQGKTSTGKSTKTDGGTQHIKKEHLKEPECSINYGSKPSEDVSRQSPCQEAVSIVSQNAVKNSGNEVGVQNTINSGNNIVRNSPGSQAQGEDSGIESMDALSEKSPHQSSSPQQSDQSQKQLGSTVHSKIVAGEKPTTLESKEITVDEITSIGEIEAALAKMEGINETFLTPCESPQHKFNGDLAMKEETLLQNLTDEKIVFCAPKIEHDLNELILENTGSKQRLECRDMNENKEINSKTSFDTRIMDECCKNKSVKLENTNEKFESVTTRNPDCVRFDDEIIEKISKTAIIVEEEKKVNEPGGHSIDQEIDIAIKENLSSKEVMVPITIDIPSHTDTDAHRIRTRASSKLESPLELPKQSPQLDSPASNIKSNLRISSQASDRLSPKINAGKGITGTGKRKRQGSESSVQSCVSDDTPGKGGGGANSSNKKSKQSNVSGGIGESVNNITTTKNSYSSGKKGISSDGCSSKTVQTKNRKNDESSDSDEPLIEVAGKVRNSKSTGKHNTEADKVLRNHRASQIKATSATSLHHISNSTKIIRGANSPSVPSGAGASVQSTLTATHFHSTRGANQVTNLVDDKIGTRRSVRASAAANKIIYSKSSVTELPKNAAAKSTAIEGMDARRKTRSAAGIETPTESKRRRSSRDSK